MSILNESKLVPGTAETGLAEVPERVDSSQ